jgi:hypothetical protein
MGTNLASKTYFRIFNGSFILVNAFQMWAALKFPEDTQRSLLQWCKEALK